MLIFIWGHIVMSSVRVSRVDMSINWIMILMCVSINGIMVLMSTGLMMTMMVSDWLYNNWWLHWLIIT